MPYVKEGIESSMHLYVIQLKQNERNKMIKKLEADSKTTNQTKIFIETPYRNDRLFKVLIRQLSKNTKLCIASGLTSGNESIATKSIDEWKKSTHTIGKKPSIFLFLA